MGELSQKASSSILSSMGWNGSKPITGTSAVTPADGYQWVAIHFVTDCVVAAQVNGTHSGDSVAVPNADLTSFSTFSAGDSVVGLWSSITLTSGEAIGYNG